MTGPPPQRAAQAAVTVGTRASPLARAQTARVAALLEAAWPGLGVEVRPIVTTGDRTQGSGEPLPEIGGKGLFTAELEQALRSGEIDFAVHSLKDLPTEPTDDVVLGAVCEREDARDCLVSTGGAALRELPPGAAIGTSSLRRAAQLRGLRHDLEIGSVRGNVDTRVRKAREGEVAGVVLAAAGIRRLGLDGEVSEWFEPDVLVPAPGQGALAVQCRAGDEAALALLSAVDDEAARAATTAERVFLRELGAGCTAPVGAYAELLAPAQGALSGSEPQSHARPSLHVRMLGLVASLDGRNVVRVEGEGEPEEVGTRLAREARSAGAEEILEGIRG